MTCRRWQTPLAVTGLAMLVIGIGVFVGCEGNKADTDEIRAALAGTPPSAGGSISIEPSSAEPNRIDEDIVFHAINGSSPIKWTVSNKDNGFIRVTSDSEVRYVVLRFGANTVIATDSAGHVASAAIIDPTSVGIFPTTASLGTDGETAIFNAINGDLPYGFSVSHPDRGTVVKTGTASALYTRTKVGNNEVIVSDGNGFFASASITQQDPTPPVVSPSTGNLSSNQTSVLLEVSGGTPPYGWSIESDDSVGSSLSTGSGTQTIYTRGVGTGTAFVRATDAKAQTDTATINLE
ncbi:MAG: hypothetical protein O2923_08155 [Verrucomicrobia bacterium]|nr:hypothetical protein [Verrucomicrobiota bacterium]MDA1088096.1 hypothetical protein [Verrucomicrobiota bacterium]